MILSLSLSLRLTLTLTLALTLTQVIQEIRSYKIDPPPDVYKVCMAVL